MEDMKWDMGGAGAVAGAMLTLALRGAKANVVGRTKLRGSLLGQSTRAQNQHQDNSG